MECINRVHDRAVREYNTSTSYLSHWCSRNTSPWVVEGMSTSLGGGPERECGYNGETSGALEAVSEYLCRKKQSVRIQDMGKQGCNERNQRDWNNIHHGRRELPSYAPNSRQPYFLAQSNRSTNIPMVAHKPLRLVPHLITNVCQYTCLGSQGTSA
ncbi:hypothetical protein BC629DRAFT_884191 [Irpex lacteus]|nr:hypothetical protein BC629DRAFT_884191 [Irpex lacteus]